MGGGRSGDGRRMGGGRSRSGGSRSHDGSQLRRLVPVGLLLTDLMKTNHESNCCNMQKVEVRPVLSRGMA